MPRKFSSAAFFELFVLFSLIRRQQIFPPEEEYGKGSAAGQDICNGLGGVDAEDASREPGQNERQGNQQNDFPQQGKKQAGLGLP